MLFRSLWPKLQEECPGVKFQLVPFDNTPENAREILANLGQNIDVIAGIFDETMLNLRRCAGLEISREPICAAVSIHHRLAGKDRLTVQDLYGEKFMMMRREWSHYVDLLRDDLWKNHPKIQIVDFDFYDVNAFNQCENNDCDAVCLLTAPVSAFDRTGRSGWDLPVRDHTAPSAHGRDSFPAAPC